MFNVGDKVWVKPQEVLAKMASSIEDGRYNFPGDLGFYMTKDMVAQAGNKLTIGSVEKKDKKGRYVYKLREVDWSWCECWLTNINPYKYPEQFDDKA